MLLACLALGGCELLFDAEALEGAGVGATGEMGAALEPGLAAAGPVAGDAFIGEAAISDDLTTVADDASLTPEMEGQLTRLLSRWTVEESEIGKVAIGRTGYLYANGYVVARLMADGDLFAPSGLRLGRFSAMDGRLYEYLSNGSERAIGSLEGFTANDGVHVYADLFGNTVVRVLRPGSVMQIIGEEGGWYRVRLVSGATGWLPSGSIVTLVLIGVAQTQQHCPKGDGVAVLRSGASIRFQKCREDKDGFSLSTTGGARWIGRADLAYFIDGDGISSQELDHPRYVLAYNGVTRFRVPPDQAFVYRPDGAPPLAGAPPPPPPPVMYKGQ